MRAWREYLLLSLVLLASTAAIWLYLQWVFSSWYKNGMEMLIQEDTDFSQRIVECTCIINESETEIYLEDFCYVNRLDSL